MQLLLPVFFIKTVLSIEMLLNKYIEMPVLFYLTLNHLTASKILTGIGVLYI